MTLQPTVCLFDLDGTLANTLPDLAAATNAALEQHDYPTSPLSDFPRMVGDGVGKLIERALGVRATPERVATVLATFLEYYDAHCLDQTTLYPGMDRAVDALLRNGLGIAVVTNKPQKQAETITRHLLGDRIAGVWGGGERYPRKPDPASVFLALEHLSVSPGEAVFVGDSDVDVFTAHAAGIPCIGVAWGFRGEDELRSAGADTVIHSAEELLCLIKES